jgi:hypothetical protein
MAYKAVLGLSEIVVGVLLTVSSFDPQATSARGWSTRIAAFRMPGCS